MVNININENFLVISLPGSAPHVMLKILELILVFHVLNENRTKTIEHDMLEWLLVLFLLLQGTAGGPSSQVSVPYTYSGYETVEIQGFVWEKRLYF